MSWIAELGSQSLSLARLNTRRYHIATDHRNSMFQKWKGWRLMQGPAGHSRMPRLFRCPRM